MKTLICGNMDKIESLYKWLDCAEEVFEVDLIISEDRLSSEYFYCEIRTISEMEELKDEYDIIFICSQLFPEYKKILMTLGINEQKIKPYDSIREYLPAKYLMELYSDEIIQKYQKQYRGGGEHSNRRVYIWRSNSKKLGRRKKVSNRQVLFYCI